MADAVIPAATGSAAVIVETAVLDPGLLAARQPDSRPDRRCGGVGRLGQFVQREHPGHRSCVTSRCSAMTRPVGGRDLAIAAGTRIATDTAVGMVVWKPVNRVFDKGVRARVAVGAGRADPTERVAAPARPGAPAGRRRQDLLVWDVAARRFGLMPLRYVTSTATSTASPSASGSPRTGSPSRTVGLAQPTADHGGRGAVVLCRPGGCCGDRPGQLQLRTARRSRCTPRSVPGGGWWWPSCRTWAPTRSRCWRWRSRRPSSQRPARPPGPARPRERTGPAARPTGPTAGSTARPGSASPTARRSSRTATQSRRRWPRCGGTAWCRRSARTRPWSATSRAARRRRCWTSGRRPAGDRPQLP